MTIKIIPPQFEGDIYMVVMEYGFHQTPLGKCATAKEAAAFAKDMALAFRGQV